MGEAGVARLSALAAEDNEDGTAWPASLGRDPGSVGLDAPRMHGRPDSCQVPVMLDSGGADVFPREVIFVDPGPAQPTASPAP
ncbi:hypothetical protein GCM10020367_60370 [Streptomyces sannanensis]|uniref:Uncharacterized protein n=1 Tax=Streptomyces sannanensis TaxID=285536 RepID=A0ABP6SKQ2_9ACTN